MVRAPSKDDQGQAIFQPDPFVLILLYKDGDEEVEGFEQQEHALAAAEEAKGDPEVSGITIYQLIGYTTTDADD